MAAAAALAAAVIVVVFISTLHAASLLPHTIFSDKNSQTIKNVANNLRGIVDMVVSGRFVEMPK